MKTTDLTINQRKQYKNNNMDVQLIQNPKDSKATILLMGLRRSGKSSICKVVFHNMRPLDTLYLESTSKPITDRFSSLIDLSVMELPGQLNYFERTVDTIKLFSSVGAIVYVIDSQDEYLNAITNFSFIVEAAIEANPDIKIEVLIHKIDGLSDDFRMDTQRDIMQRTGDELLDLGLEGVQISFYLTSIFDHSIYEAFSRIVQKLIPELPSLEIMLDNINQHCKIEKIFLFDINSKVYVATDSSPVDLQTYQVCAEFIDISIDLDVLYKSTTKDATIRKESRSVSILQNGTVLYMKHMIRGLALVAIVRVEEELLNYTMTIVDHNVQLFRIGLENMWKNSKYLVDPEENRNTSNV